MVARLENIAKQSLLIWALLGCFIIFSSVMRGFFLWHYQTQLIHLGHEIRHCFHIGVLFDLKAATYVLAIPYILNLIGFNRRAIHIACVFLATIAMIVVIINYYYYRAFGNNFDQAIFNFQGQAGAVWISVWQDYPVVTITFFSAALCYALIAIYRFIEKKIILPPLPAFVLVLLNIAMCLMYIIAMRGGSIGTFPLLRTEAEFSAHKVINSAAYNGVIALADVMKQKIKTYPQVTLVEGMQYYNAFHDRHLSPKQFSFRTIFTRTPKNIFLKNNPPHVVFIQIESMGRHLLLFDKEGYNDMLGALRPFIKRDFVFSHFVSDYNNTAPTLARLTFNSPIQDVFTSKLGDANYKTFVTTPFHQAGYKTIYITPGELGWYKSGELLTKQGFDSAVGKFDISRHYPQAYTSEAWGLYDEYAYDYALYLLHEATKQHQPLFIYINTVTNHPPYSTPPNYSVKSLHVPEEFAKKMQVPDKKMHDIFASYQYTNHALGNFLDAITHSDFKDRTIIAATGDHNQHELMPNYAENSALGLQYEVFFLLHVPTEYLQGKTIDVTCPGSHKDIFPTLYHLALSDALYPDLGNNLVGKCLLTFGNNEKMLVLSDGIITLTGQKRFYPWVGKDKVYVGKGQALNNEQHVMLKRAQAYQALLRWQTLYQYSNAVDPSLVRSSR